MCETSLDVDLPIKLNFFLQIQKLFIFADLRMNNTESIYDIDDSGNYKCLLVTTAAAGALLLRLQEGERVVAVLLLLLQAIDFLLEASHFLVGVVELSF